MTFEEMREIMDEFFETTSYDVIVRDWRDVPETGFDPDDSEEDEARMEDLGLI